MLSYFSDMFDALTQDQRDYLIAKLTSASSASRVVEYDLEDFGDNLQADGDLPEDFLCETDIWAMRQSMQNAQARIYDHILAQRAMRDELTDIRACI